MTFPHHITAKQKNTALSLIVTLCALTLPPNSAWADCTAPVGVKGEMIYNSAHKIMQYCDGTKWIGAGATPGVTNGNKGEIVVSNNGQTWQLAPLSCPAGMTELESFCYTPLQPAANIIHAQTVCKGFKNADTCTGGEYYLIETGSTMRWTNSYCGGTQGVVVTTGSGWNCAAYSNQYQYRCCAPKM